MSVASHGQVAAVDFGASNTDVVVHDGLVGDEVMALIPAHARRISVAKRRARHTLASRRRNVGSTSSGLRQSGLCTRSSAQKPKPSCCCGASLAIRIGMMALSWLVTWKFLRSSA